MQALVLEKHEKPRTPRLILFTNKTRQTTAAKARLSQLLGGTPGRATRVVVLTPACLLAVGITARCPGERVQVRLTTPVVTTPSTEREISVLHQRLPSM